MGDEWDLDLLFMNVIAIQGCNVMNVILFRDVTVGCSDLDIIAFKILRELKKVSSKIKTFRSSGN